MNNNSQSPIFIHSLFRTGSTYIFNVFRRLSEAYSCYQEPLNEYLTFLSKDAEALTNIHKETAQSLRHPSLDKPYFYEFYIISEILRDTFYKEFTYDTYFALNERQKKAFIKYFHILEQSTPKRTIFQLCRSLGRIDILKSEFQGHHGYLWRNPWDQWWSCRVGFDTNHLLILNAQDLPEVFQDLKTSLKMPNFHSKEIFQEYRFFNDFWLSPQQSYLLFYTLWCYGILEARQHCNLFINIDMLSASSQYRMDITKQLFELNINGLDFSDCNIPLASYYEQDIRFFEPEEERVYRNLIKCGYTLDDINFIKNIRTENLVDFGSNEPKFTTMARDIERSRELANGYQTKLAASPQKYSDLKKEYFRLKENFIDSIEALEDLSERELVLEAAVQNLTMLTHEKELRCQQLEAELSVILNSTSMRITAPFRLITRWKKGLTHLSELKSVFRLIFQSAARSLIVRKFYKKIAPYIPYKLKKKIKKAYLSSGSSSLSEQFHNNFQQQLSPDAKKVFQDIKSSIRTGM
ncbi:MAG: hypothetical protein AAF572_06970 [Cyanobacteria bacterium P01_B01_bin.77]